MADGKRDEATLLLRDNLLVEGARVDWFLQELVDLVNSSEGFEFGATLNVQGSIISGVLINGRKYFELLSQLLHDNNAESFAEWIAGFSAVYPTPEEQEEGAVASGQPGYVHMRDARVFGTYDSAIPGNQGMLWRGRINAISGFSIGQLGVTPPDDDS